MNRFVIIIMSSLFIWHSSSIIGAEEMPSFDKDAFIASAGLNRTLELGMVDCIAIALKNNSEIRVKRISPLIEDANIMIERSKFEPDLSFDFTMEDNTELTSFTLTGRNPSKTRTGKFNFGYDERFVTGTQVSLDFYNTRTRSNSVIQNPNPAFDSEAEITITQPLLKGFGILVNKAYFLIAKNNRLKSNQDFLQEVIKVLTDVKRSYYDYQYSQEQYKVAEISLKRVQSLHQINQERYSKGLASDVDLLESESEAARMEEALLAAEGAMRLSEDKLKLVTNLVDDIELWNARIVLLDRVEFERSQIDLVDAIKKAFMHRPDYESAKIDLRNKDISIAFNKNGMLPTVDLIGSFGLNGLSKVYEKDLAHIGGGKYQDWSIGVKVSMPLGSEEEKARYEKSKLEKALSLINFKRLEQKMILEVRDAVRKVDITYRTQEASVKSRDAEEKRYQAEEERFKAGLVSTHDILDYQERLMRAESSYIKSIIDYNLSLIELAKAEGMTLVNDNIRVE